MTAATIAVIFLVLAIASVASIALAANNVIRRNHIIGIRTAATLSSDDAWIRGHRAGLPPAAIGGAASAGFAIAGMIASASAPTPLLSEVLVGCSIAAILVGGVWSTVRASKFARDVRQ